MDLDTLYNQVTEAVAEIIDNNGPDVTIENDGIGFYDYGDQRCFDKGEDFFVLDDNDEREIFIPITDVSMELLNEVVKHTNEEKFYTMGHHNLVDYEYSFIRVEYSISKMEIVDGGLNVTVKFGDDIFAI